MSREKNTIKNTKECISFRRLVPAGGQGTIRERIKANGTIEGFRINFHLGQELTFHVLCEVVHKGDKHESFITYAGETDNFLSGNDEIMEFPIVLSVENDDEVWISYVNTDLVNQRHLSVDVYIDYYGGSDRVVGGAV